MGKSCPWMQEEQPAWCPAEHPLEQTAALTLGFVSIPGCHVAPAGGIYMKGVGERRGMRVDRATGKG